MVPNIAGPLPVLHTPRLRLRAMKETDAATVVAWRNAVHVASMSRETARGDLTIDRHLQWFASSRGERVDYIIEQRPGDRPIGSVAFVWRDLITGMRCAESSKYIGERSALGKGYGFEAALRWVEFGFVNLQLDYICARTRRDNLANIKINERLGYTFGSWPRQLGPASDEWVFMFLARRAWRPGQVVGEGR